MPRTITYRPKVAAHSRRIFAMPLALGALLLSGCVTKKRPAFAIPAAAVARPVVRSASDVPLEAPPEIRVETEAPLLHLATSRNGPARPRVASQPPPETVNKEKPADPLIAPELSAAELASAENDTARSLEAAEKSLGQIQGRALNAAQKDLASKVRAFMESAREAMKIGDWSRARNLSRKAEVLSAELSGNQ